MLFNTPLFLFVYMPLVLLGFVLLGRFGRRAAIGWLAIASIVFYAQWNPAFVLLLLGSILVNYLISRRIAATAQQPRRQSLWLWLGILANLGALAYFKYLFPVLHFLTQIGVTERQWGDMVLPLGVSFFTFTQIAYLIDLKQGEAEPQGVTSYALFVTFFPHLIAGPILHHKEMMPQFAAERRYRLDRADVAVGVTWFVLGLFKKVVIADTLAIQANAAFGDPWQQTVAAAWLGALNYILQLYFDFSGYSDMAIGLARIFSIRFPYNFNSPFIAASVVEFWQRWHMTLTRYITLYLYNPISLWVNRRRMAQGKKISGKAMKTLGGFASMVAFPTVATMFIAGIWHGAGFQFLIFGLIHGVAMTIEHAWTTFHPPIKGAIRKPVWHALAVLRTNLIVLVAFIFFRAPSTSAAFGLLGSMLGLQHVRLQGPHPQALLALAMLPVVWWMPNTQQIIGEGSPMKAGAAAGKHEVRRFWFEWRPQLAWGFAVAGVFFFTLIFMQGNATFLYFQF
jgi:alginate O-acetyltransferase complex protein AlgI